MKPTSPEPTADRPEDRLPLNRRHLLIAAVCALGLFVDVMEIAMGSAFSAVFSASGQAVSPGQLAWLLSSAYIGAVIGAPLFGWIGDRVGRRRAMVATLALLALTSFAAAASSGFDTLFACRLVSGFAIGAYPPLMIAYLADVMAPAYRGRVLMLVSALALLGGPAMVFLVRALTPLAPWGFEGWRWGFAVGGVGAALVCIACLRLKESARWLRAAGREAQAAEASAWLAAARPLRSAGTPSLPVERAPRRSALPASPVFFAAIFFLSPWATVGFGLLSGAALMAKGFSMQDSLLVVGLFTVGAVVGSLIASVFVDRVERRTVLVASALAMAITCTAFAASATLMPTLVTSFLFGVFASMYVPSLSLHLAEMTPTHWRAFAGAGGWAINRLASVLVPLALLPLLKSQGSMAMCAVMAVTLVCSAVLLAAGQAGRSGRAVA